jgi:phosphorylcholine metabolism protein LicD
MAKLIIIIFIFIIILLCLYKTDETFVNVDALTPYNNLQDTVSILKQVTQILKDNNITHWVIHATLLGAVRNKHMLTWVDDADISIHYNDLPKLLSIEEELNRNNIGIMKQKDRYKLYRLNSMYPFVDVFPVIESNNKYIYENNIARETLKKEYFYKNELLPLQEYEFEDYYVYGPNIPTRYLDTNFKNWKNKGYKSGWINSTRTFIQPITFDLKYSMKPYLWIEIKDKDYIKELTNKYNSIFNIMILKKPTNHYKMLLLYKYGGIYINGRTNQDLSYIMKQLKKYDFVNTESIIASRANTRLMGMVLKNWDSVHNNNILSDTIKDLVINENYLFFPSNNK